jgi:selenocysteine lyase/cysteine desulfurase
MLNTNPDNIALTESATSSWDRAFAAIAFTEPPAAGSRILVSSSEYASNVLPIMQLAKRTGAVMEFIPDNASGVTDVDAFADMLDSSVSLVAINHCPSQNGLINDVTAIGEIMHGNNSRAWYLIDACQSIGQLPVDAPAIGADFLSATGRKFLRGPRGTGFLYCSPRALTELEPFPIDLHGGHWNSATDYQLRDGARRFESWEKSYASILGLGAAVGYAQNLEIDAIAHRISTLSSYTRATLESITGIEVLDRGAPLSGIVTFRHESIDAVEFVAELKAHGVNVSLGTPDYSQVDYLAHGVESLVRVSPHVYNTEAEIDRLIELVSDKVARANA